MCHEFLGLLALLVRVLEGILGSHCTRIQPSSCASHWSPPTTDLTSSLKEAGMCRASWGVSTMTWNYYRGSLSNWNATSTLL